MSKDIIYREDAIKTLTENVMFEFTEDEEWAITCLQNLPSADRPQGEWTEREVFRSDDNNTSNPIIDDWQSAKCSVCGKYHTTPYLYYFDNFNYCPNCGARMKGADNE